MANTTNDTQMLFSVMPRNMSVSFSDPYTPIGSPFAMFSSVMST